MICEGKTNILALYRGKLAENRGTPIRARSLLRELAGDHSVVLSVFSWDEKGTLEFPNHECLRNNHWDDLKRLFSYIREHDVDIVVGHSMAASYYLFPLKLLASVKIVLEMHGFLEEEKRLYGKMSAFAYHKARFFYGLFYRVCDLITTCSDSATKYLSRYNNNVKSVYGGVDLSLFNQNVLPSSFFKKRKGDIIIGYAGDSRKWQGLPFLMDTYEKLHKDHPEFRLVLLTSEQRYDLREGVERVPPVDHSQVAGFFAQCDILILPREDNPVNRLTYPSKLMEYLAMGKAVVASKTSDCHHIIEHNKSGMVFEPSDAEGLIEVLLELRNPALRERLGKEAFKTAQKYTWDKQAALFWKYVKEVL